MNKEELIIYLEGIEDAMNAIKAHAMADVITDIIDKIDVELEDGLETDEPTFVWPELETRPYSPYNPWNPTWGEDWNITTDRTTNPWNFSIRSRGHMDFEVE